MGEPLRNAPREGGPEGLPPEEAVLKKATLSRLDGDLKTLEVGWNPRSYRLSRAASSAEPALPFPQVAPRLLSGGTDRFSTELFLDATREPPGRRDARGTAEELRRWMEPLPESLLPPRVLFLWGPLRFAGTIEEIEEEWIQFDPDGTPVRGRLRLRMRG